MNAHHSHRVPRLLAALLVAAALTAPVAAADGGSNPTLRNDAAHYGRQLTSSPVDPTLRNDMAHNRTPSAPAQSAPTPIVVEVDGGFDWISAGVGAVGAGGFLLVLGAATTGLRRRSATA
jgi:hypothetical protein